MFEEEIKAQIKSLPLSADVIRKNLVDDGRDWDAIRLTAVDPRVIDLPRNVHSSLSELT